MIFKHIYKLPNRSFLSAFLKIKFISFFLTVRTKVGIHTWFIAALSTISFHFNPDLYLTKGLNNILHTTGGRRGRLSVFLITCTCRDKLWSHLSPTLESRCRGLSQNLISFFPVHLSYRNSQNLFYLYKTIFLFDFSIFTAFLSVWYNVNNNNYVK